MVENPRVTATDDPELAKRLGLTEWDEEHGQYVAPSDSDEHNSDEPDDDSTTEVERTDGSEVLTGAEGAGAEGAGAEGLQETGPGGDAFVIDSRDEEDQPR